MRPDDVELRFTPAAANQLPVTSEKREEGGRISGLAIAYGALSEDLGGFREVIEEGAFDAVLENPSLDVIACFNHDPDQLLGRSRSGTLKLWSDSQGLHYSIEPLPDTELTRSVMEHIRLGNISGSSFAFTANKDGTRIESRADTGTVRYVTKATGLFDVSPVVSPAYSASSVSLRSVQAHNQRSRGLSPAELLAVQTAKARILRNRIR